VASASYYITGENQLCNYDRLREALQLEVHSAVLQTTKIALIFTA